jgi:Na+-driven multidrug efflux pump
MLAMLSRRVEPTAPSAAIAGLLRLFAPTGLLVLRTAAISGTYAAAVGVAARCEQPAAAAAHHVAFQVWLSCSLLADSVAVAAQSLLAAALAAGDTARARTLIMRVLKLACLLGGALGLVLFGGRHMVAAAFTSDPLVLLFISGIMPLVVASQPINAAAFALDGVIFGAGGFGAACVCTAGAALPALACIAAGAAAPGDNARLLWVWLGLLALMVVRAATIAGALLAGVGPFERLGPWRESRGVDMEGGR